MCYGSLHFLAGFACLAGNAPQRLLQAGTERLLTGLDGSKLLREVGHLWEWRGRGHRQRPMDNYIECALQNKAAKTSSKGEDSGRQGKARQFQPRAGLGLRPATGHSLISG